MSYEFRDRVDLASARVGGSVVYATDDFFAEKENLVKPSAPVWDEHAYTDRGKWMDGWESRRKRTPGDDFCIVRLGIRGVIRGVVVDTSYFRGNYPDRCQIEACDVRPESSVDELLSDAVRWTIVVPESPLRGDSENLFVSETPFAFTHIRLRIFPDGGVARLRVHGEPEPDWRRAGGLGGEVDLAAVENGGDVLGCSDMFFGPKHNLIMPGLAHNMSDGWETKRRRGPGHDWVIVKLATEALLRRVEVDTSHFKGNHPDTASIDAARSATDDLSEAAWTELLPRTKLQPHTRHVFADELVDVGPVTHIRLNVFPDGGVSRLRLFGLATEAGRCAAVVRRLNTLSQPESELGACCAASRWGEAVASHRPFRDWNDLMGHAESIWQELSEDDWQQAFAAHPPIGERSSPHQSSVANRWSAGEQAGVEGDAARERLAALNREYEERFGRTFIICATGRGPDEIETELRRRLASSPDDELREAAGEQQKITKLRLEKLVQR